MGAHDVPHSKRTDDHVSDLATIRPMQLVPPVLTPPKSVLASGGRVVQPDCSARHFGTLSRENLRPPWVQTGNGGDSQLASAVVLRPLCAHPIHLGQQSMGVRPCPPATQLGGEEVDDGAVRPFAGAPALGGNRPISHEHFETRVSARELPRSSPPASALREAVQLALSTSVVRLRSVDPGPWKARNRRQRSHPKTLWRHVSFPSYRSSKASPRGMTTRVVAKTRSWSSASAFSGMDAARVVGDTLRRWRSCGLALGSGAHSDLFPLAPVFIESSILAAVAEVSPVAAHVPRFSRTDQYEFHSLSTPRYGQAAMDTCDP